MRIIGIGGRGSRDIDLDRVKLFLNGGRRGQALYKNSDDPYDFSWYAAGDAPEATIPANVIDLIVSAGTDRALLSWTAPDSGGAPITDYIIRYSTDNFSSNNVVFADGVSTESLALVTGLSEDTQYWFKVEPRNSIGDSTSNVVTAVTGAATSDTPIVSMEQSIINVEEDAGNVVVNVVCDRDPENVVNVGISIGGSAQQGLDYTLGNIVIQFIPGGPLTQSITVPIIDDSEIEESETIEFSITGATNADIGLLTSTTVNIEDNDIQTIGFLDSIINSAEGETVTVRVTADKVSTGATTIPIEVSGTADGEDYQFVGPSSITIPDGETIGELTINLVDDGILEGLESLILTLEPAVISDQYAIDSNNSSMLIRIGDTGSSTSVVSFDAGTAVGQEGSQVNLPIRISPVLSAPITVTLVSSGTATPGTDWSYFSGNGNITIPANTSVFNVPISLLSDGEVEGSETAIFTLTGLNSSGDVELGAQDAMTVTITDLSTPDAAYGFESLSTAAQEPDGVGTIQSRGIRLVNTGGATEADTIVRISVSGTATYNQDYTIQGVSSVSSGIFDFVIPQGQDSFDLQVDLIGDAIEEGEESIIIDIDSVTESGSNAALDIGPISSHTMQVFDFIPSRQDIPSTNDITLTPTTLVAPSLGINETYALSATGISIPVRAIILAREIWLTKNAGNEILLEQTLKEGNPVRIGFSGDMTTGPTNGAIQIHGGSVNAQNERGSWNYIRTENMTSPYTGNTVEVEIGEVVRDIVLIGTTAEAENNIIGDINLNVRGAKRAIPGDFSSFSHNFFGRYDNIRFENLQINKQSTGRDTVGGSTALPRFWPNKPEFESNREGDFTAEGSGSLKMYDCIFNAFSAFGGDPNNSSYSYAHGKFGIRNLTRFRYDIRACSFYPNEEHSIYVDSPRGTAEMPSIFMGCRQIQGPPVPNHPTAPQGIIGNSTTFMQVVNRQGEKTDGNWGPSGYGPMIFFDNIARDNCSPNATAFRGGSDFTTVGHDGDILYKDCQSIGSAFSTQASSARGILTCWSASAHIFQDFSTGQDIATRSLTIDNLVVATDSQSRGAVNLRAIGDINIISFDMTASTNWGAQYDFQFNNFNGQINTPESVPNLRVSVPANFGSYPGFALEDRKVIHYFTSDLSTGIFLTPQQMDVYDGSDPV